MDLNLKPPRVAPAILFASGAAGAAFSLSESSWVEANPAAFFVSSIWFLAASAMALFAIDRAIAGELKQEQLERLDNSARQADERADAVWQKYLDPSIPDSLRGHLYDLSNIDRSLSISLQKQALDFEKVKVGDSGIMASIGVICLLCAIGNIAWVLAFGPLLEFNLKFPPVF